jgi:hypothetical protein
MDVVVDAEVILTKLHGAVRRLLTTSHGQPLQGLSAVARACRRSGTLSNDLAKKAVQLDDAVAWMRHASVEKAANFLAQVAASLTSHRAVGSPRSSSSGGSGLAQLRGTSQDGEAHHQLRSDDEGHYQLRSDGEGHHQLRSGGDELAAVTTSGCEATGADCEWYHLDASTASTQTEAVVHSCSLSSTLGQWAYAAVLAGELWAAHSGVCVTAEADDGVDAAGMGEGDVAAGTGDGVACRVGYDSAESQDIARSYTCARVGVATRSGPAQHHSTACGSRGEHLQLRGMIAISACEGVSVASQVGEEHHQLLGEAISAREGVGVATRIGITHPQGMDTPLLASLGSPGESMQSARRNEGGNSDAQACELVSVAASERVGVATRIRSVQHQGKASHGDEEASHDGFAYPQGLICISARERVGVATRIGSTHPQGIVTPHLASLGSPGESMQSARRNEGGNCDAQAGELVSITACERVGVATRIGSAQHTGSACQDGEAHHLLIEETAISACEGAEEATRTGPAQHLDAAWHDGEGPHQLHDEVAISACEGVGVATRTGSVQHQGKASHGDEGASHGGLAYPQGLICISACERVGVATCIGPTHPQGIDTPHLVSLDSPGESMQSARRNEGGYSGAQACELGSTTVGERVGVATRIGPAQLAGSACLLGETAISACEGAETAACSGPAQHFDTACHDGDEHRQTPGEGAAGSGPARESKEARRRRERREAAETCRWTAKWTAKNPGMDPDEWAGVLLRIRREITEMKADAAIQAEAATAQAMDTTGGTV